MKRSVCLGLFEGPAVKEARGRRTAVEDGQVGEVRPAVAEQDGGVSAQAADAAAVGVLQAGCCSQRRHPHRDTVPLQTTTHVSVYTQLLLEHVTSLL